MPLGLPESLERSAAHGLGARSGVRPLSGRPGAVALAGSELPRSGEEGAPERAERARLAP